MNLDYFEYNGVKYTSGTGIIIKKFFNDTSGFTDRAYFVYHNTDSDVVWIQMPYTCLRRGYPMDQFKEMLVGLTGEYIPSIHPPQVKRLRDSQIPRLIFGWVWYIFIMVISIIFQGVIVIWIVASIAFFNWRKKVIEEEGYYVER